MAWFKREFSMDPSLIDRIREDIDLQDPLAILLAEEQAWITDRNSLDYNRFCPNHNLRIKT